jgi:hypothetical protein
MLLPAHLQKVFSGCYYWPLGCYYQSTRGCLHLLRLLHRYYWPLGCYYCTYPLAGDSIFSGYYTGTIGPWAATACPLAGVSTFSGYYSTEVLLVPGLLLPVH